MRRFALLAIVLAGALLSEPLARVPLSAAASGDEHSYFNGLIARADHWKSYSLRDPRQLDYPKNGGYIHGNTGRIWVTYDPAGDSDPQRQDAAKVVIPAFGTGADARVADPVSSTDLELWLSDGAGDRTKVNTSLNVKGITLRLGDGEYVTAISDAYPLDRTTGRYRLASRGVMGTVAKAHAVSTAVTGPRNSLSSQVRLPLGTQNGRTYFFTWDTYYTDSYLGMNLTNHKAYQFESDGIWFEAQTRFSGGYGPPDFDRSRHVATVTTRSYAVVGGQESWLADPGKMGPGITKIDPILPMDASFIIHPNRWVRWWVRLEQRANDYDYIDVWVADEQNEPVQLYSRVPHSVRNDTVQRFWLEFNTSTDTYRGSMRDLVAYVRNFAALVDPPDNVTPLLLRPLPGMLPPGEARPAPPTNLRVLSTGLEQ